MTNETMHDQATDTFGLPSDRDSALAFAALEKDRAALAPDELVKLTVDVRQAVSIALKNLPKVYELAPEQAVLPGFDKAHVKRVELAAMALWHAQAERLATSESPLVRALVAEGLALRQVMLPQARLLAVKDVLPQAAVDAIPTGTSYLDVAQSLEATSRLFRRYWRGMENKTVLTTEDLDRASALAMQILQSLGQASPANVAGKDAVVRSFTLLLKEYGEIQRALAWHRWHEGDAGELAPSLYTPRRVRRSKVSSVAQPTPSGAASDVAKVEAPKVEAPKVAESGKPASEVAGHAAAPAAVASSPA